LIIRRDGFGFGYGQEENLNHFSEQGFGVHRIVSAPLQTEQSAFVIVGRRSV
jgi:hypothetical protein